MLFQREELQNLNVRIHIQILIFIIDRGFAFS